MSILNQLSSQVGDSSEQSNLEVVALCRDQPALLAEIAAGLTSNEAALMGDCAEVLAKVAEDQPDLVAPYASALTQLLTHKTTRVRWEAIHALALIAPEVPETIHSLLPRLREMLHNDSSVIVRDYATEAIGNYAKTGSQTAQAAYPILLETLTVWNEKHAGRALDGLSHVAAAAPELADELHRVGLRYHDHGRGVVRKAAKGLLRTVEGL